MNGSVCRGVIPVSRREREGYMHAHLSSRANFALQRPAISAHTEKYGKRKLRFQVIIIIFYAILLYICIYI